MFGEAAFAHLLKHFAHLGVLAEELVDVLHTGAGAGGDAFAARAGDDFVVASLEWRHGADDGLESDELLFVDLTGSLLKTGEGTDGIWVSVADTGGGIPPELLNRIFEPFYTTKNKGSGLGLMIVQRIVRAHSGHIEVESQVGRGATFRIWLPLHERKPRLLEAPMHD